MKNKMIALLISLGIVLAMTPQKSEAGLLVGALAGNAAVGATVGGAIGAAWVVAGTIFAEGKPFGTPENSKVFTVMFIAPAVVMTLLDVDATLGQEQLVASLKAVLPFIDSSEVIERVAEQTKTKARVQVEQSPYAHQVMVTFTDLEIAEVLSGTDLSDEQYLQVTQVLQ